MPYKVYVAGICDIINRTFELPHRLGPQYVHNLFKILSLGLYSHSKSNDQNGANKVIVKQTRPLHCAHALKLSWQHSAKT